jgi:hypothetical protein
MDEDWRGEGEAYMYICMQPGEEEEEQARGEEREAERRAV